MTMHANKEENAGMWQAICNSHGGGYAIIEHRGKTQWRKKTAVKHAAEFKSKHMSDAWAQPVES